MKIQNKTPLFLFLLLSIFYFYSCTPTNSSSPKGWTKVFSNDENGKTMFGDKAELLSAVRSGYPIKIGFGGGRIEHIANADFLTISLGEEVFAQIPPIIGQRPSFTTDSLKVDFRPSNKWTLIAGTNGSSARLMTDYLNNTIENHRSDREMPITWYVNYNSAMIEENAKPLWHPSSKLWEEWNKNSSKN